MTTIPSNSALIIIDMINPFDFDHRGILARETLLIINPLKKFKGIFQEKQVTHSICKRSLNL